MFSHVILGVADLERSGVFYAAVLSEVGLMQRVVKSDGGPRMLSFAKDQDSLPRLFLTTPYNGEQATAGNGSMLSFIAPSEEAVRKAHAAGLALGGTDEGAPGLRTHYAPDYFGAYLRDPDGNKISFVFRSAWVAV